MKLQRNFSLKAIVSRLFKFFEIDISHYETDSHKITWFYKWKFAEYL